MTSSRVRPITVDNDDDDSYEDNPKENVDTVIASFTKELDQLTQSLDDNVDFSTMLQEARHRRHTPKKKVHQSPRIRQTSFQTPQSAPSLRSRPSPAAEPTPVRTPAYDMLSPAPHVFQRQEERERSSNVQSTPDYQHMNSSTDDHEWKLALDSMRDMMERQEARIQFLERENEELRAQVKHWRRERASMTEPRRYSRPSEFTPPQRYRYEQDSRRHRHHYDEERRSSDFSPGTKFVAELSKVVDLEPGHHAPLSMIMDRQLERIARRKRNEWDR